MQPSAISAALAPFLPPDALSSAQLAQVSDYLDLLLKWNARTNLTAIRSPQDILTRHFGESFFLAHALFGRPSEGIEESAVQVLRSHGQPVVFDLGSGAGFPGLPLKLYAPHIRLTLIEANHKKAAFLKEVVRAIRLMDVNVFAGRAEDFGLDSAEDSSNLASVVTLRAVERFQSVLPVAARLLAPAGRLALLVGVGQLPQLYHALPNFTWSAPTPIPLSVSRVVILSAKVE